MTNATMPDASTTDATAVIDRYVAAWNETDPARRRELIARTWSEDGSYLDPLMAGDGHDGIDAMIAAVQERFPGHGFRLIGAVDHQHDRVRFAWELAPADGEPPLAAGTDFGVLAGDGRLRSVTGFLDRALGVSEG